VEEEAQASSAKVTLRNLPHPYRAMLAVCSDLDETLDASTYLETSRYLNGTDVGTFGRGLGLEVGNSIYFHMPEGHFSYWGTSDAIRARLRDLMKSGHIDCIHSYGDLATSREQAQKIVQHLQEHDCRLGVWIDHAVAPSNLGADIMQGHGDVRDAEVYHSDLTLAYGVRYVWLGRVTSMVGQDMPPSLGDIWTKRYPIGSLVTLAKESVKYYLAKLGHEKYRMHSRNRIFRGTQLRDGQKVLEFMRSNPHPLGISVGDNAQGMGEVLSNDVLDRLEARRGKAIFYTHLGKKIDSHSGFDKKSRSRLESLADRMARKSILVLTTRRLLDYCDMLESVTWSTAVDQENIEISVNLENAEQGGQGLSFDIPKGTNARLLLNGKELAVERYQCDRDGHDVITVPWTRLTYPGPD
jgi:hypothetical protein